MVGQLTAFLDGFRMNTTLEKFRKTYITKAHDVLVRPTIMPLSALKLPRNSRLLAIGSVPEQMQDTVLADGELIQTAVDVDGAVHKHIEFLKTAPDIDGINLILLRLKKPTHHGRWSLIRGNTPALPNVAKREGWCLGSTRVLFDFAELAEKKALVADLPESVTERTFYAVANDEFAVMFPGGVRALATIQAYRHLYNMLFGEK